MPSKRLPDVLVLGAGPAGMAIASALGKEKLEVEVLSPNGPDEPWPNTYGIWGKEVDQLGLQDLLEYRWKNTVSFFGHGSLEDCLLYTSPSPRDKSSSRMPSSA